jgi:ABC-type phosphate/phosphonate transport system permease subunit
MAYDRAMVIIGMIFVLVLVVEQLSSYFRKMVMKNER